MANSNPRVPWSQVLAWSSGSMGDNMLAWTIAYLVVPIYQVAMGISPIVIGYCVALPRIVDAIMDSFAGSWSDNARTRWGRRRPFILIAGGISVFFYILAWWCPMSLDRHVFTMNAFGQTLTLSALTVFVVVTTVIYLGVYAFFAIPYYALGVELTTDYHERTRIQSIRFIFNSFSQLLLPNFYKLSLFLGKAIEADAAEPELVGIRYVGLAAGLVIFITIVLVFVFCRENTQVQSQPKMNFFNAVVLTLKNRVYLMMVGLSFLILLGFFLIQPIGWVLGIYYVAGGNKELAADVGACSGMMVGGMNIIFSLGPMMWLARRFGKKQVLIGAQVVAIIGFLSNWVFLTPEHPYWSLIPWIIIAPGQLAVWVIGGSIGADIVDLDELDTGLRREGMYSAVSSMVTKGGIGLSALISGYLMVGAGYVTDTIPEGRCLFNLRLLYILVPSLFTLVAMGIAIVLPISEKRMLEVRRILDESYHLAAEQKASAAE